MTETKTKKTEKKPAFITGLIEVIQSTLAFFDGRFEVVITKKSGYAIHDLMTGLFYELEHPKKLAINAPGLKVVSESGNASSFDENGNFVSDAKYLIFHNGLKVGIVKFQVRPWKVTYESLMKHRKLDRMIRINKNVEVKESEETIGVSA